MRSGFRYLGSLLLLVPFSLSADELTQTDWSGGPGLPGPVNEWGDRFSASIDISWRAIPGQIALSSVPLTTPLEDRLDDSFDGGISVYASDIDGDGDTDIIGSAYYTNDVKLWMNQGGDPVSWSEYTIDGDFTHPAEVYAADVDGDGRTDILGSAYDAALISWWRNDGGDPSAWVENSIKEGYHGAHDVWAGDLDDDGDTDVVGVAAEDDEIAWWRNEGGDPIQWSEQVIDDQVDYPCRVEAVDIDHDGRLDVLAAIWTDREVAWWRNGGGDPIVWDKQIIRSNYTGAHGIHSADLDDDGDIDVIGAAMNLGDVTIWWNEGGDPISWSEQVVAGNFNGAGYVYSHDIDGDGDLDIVGSSWGSGGIAWWQNGGGGNTWTKHTIIQGVGQTSSVYADDIDGDGDIDILGTGWDADFISWWQVTEFLGEGELVSSIVDRGSEEQLERIEWSAIGPAGTECGFQLRCSDDPDAMGEWSPEIVTPIDLNGYQGRYVQYKALMRTADPRFSPILIDMAMMTNSVGGETEPLPFPSQPTHGCVPNPACGTVTVNFTLPEDCRVNLGLFDLHGRRISTITEAYYSAGSHSIQSSPLPSGTYICRMVAGAHVSTRRLVRLE